LFFGNPLSLLSGLPWHFPIVLLTDSSPQNGAVALFVIINAPVINFQWITDRKNPTV